ncbi:hypothetical protein NQ315_015333 [Exocentrus adspersus]|uniref:YqaJ viral recombinase domain-containing protein n=1 Tax=Exocentrus adspersus TaxID=1586481 RepID=A0AAV8V6Q6_9CUCU|nr:hypothetical protein NQ315_015333 [Exocentrus adspersus]
MAFHTLLCTSQINSLRVAASALSIYQEGCIKNLEEFEEISQTDLKCVWSTQKSVTQEKYSAVSINQIPCFKDQVKQSLRGIGEEDLYNFFIEKLPESALALNISKVGRRSCTNVVAEASIVLECNHYQEAILDVACQSVLMMEISSVQISNQNKCCKERYWNLFSLLPEVIIIITQQSQEWHIQRKYRVLVYMIYIRIQKVTGKVKHNKYTKHGIKYESDAREAFVKQTLFHVVECGYSPDGIIFEGKRPVALLEIKCLYEGATHTISEVVSKTKYLEKCGSKYRLKEKHKYYGQIQLGMALLNVERCYFVLYASFDKSIEICEVDINYNFAKKMLTILINNHTKAIILDALNKLMYDQN